MVEATALSSAAQEDPLTFSAAILGEDAKSWRKAIDTEINAITENKTWSLVPRTEGDNILTSKWVFKCKETINADGTQGRKHRARIVVRGFQQKKGLTTTKRMPR